MGIGHRGKGCGKVGWEGDQIKAGRNRVYLKAAVENEVGNVLDSKQCIREQLCKC